MRKSFFVLREKLEKNPLLNRRDFVLAWSWTCLLYVFVYFGMRALGKLNAIQYVLKVKEFWHYLLVLFEGFRRRINIMPITLMLVFLFPLFQAILPFILREHNVFFRKHQKHLPHDIDFFLLDKTKTFIAAHTYIHGTIQRI